MNPRLPAITARKLIRFLKRQGFVEARQTGSHLTLWREEDGRAVTIPVHTGQDIGRGLLRRILKDAGYTIEEFLAKR